MQKSHRLVWWWFGGSIGLVGLGCGGMPEPREHEGGGGAAGSQAGAAGSAWEATGGGSAWDGVWQYGGGTGGVYGGGTGGVYGGGTGGVYGGGTGGDGAAGTGGSGGTGGGYGGSGGDGTVGIAGGGTGGQGATGTGGSGGIGLHEVGCLSSEDCVAGLGCLFHPAASTGACFALCDNSADCTSPSHPCVHLGAEGAGYCLPDCDPRAPQNDQPPFTPCGSGAGCTLDSVNRASYCTAENDPSGEHGTFCQDSTDCAVGHTCQRRTCSRYCLIGSAECDGIARTACAQVAVLGSGAAFGYCHGGYYVATDVPAAIPDLGMLGSTISVADSFPVARVMVRVSVAHPYCSDLGLTLYAPDGAAVTLHQGGGGMAEDCYSATYFDDAAPQSIAAAAPPYNGAFRPEQALGALTGADSRGEWSLAVSDETAGDTGDLTSWELTLY